MRKTDPFHGTFLAGCGHRYRPCRPLGDPYPEGFDAGKQWLWFPGIALAMFFFRRFMRGKLEAMAERERGRSGSCPE